MTNRPIRIASAVLLILAVAFVFAMPSTNLPASKIKRPLLVSALLVAIFDGSIFMRMAQVASAIPEPGGELPALPLVEKNCCRLL